MLFGERKRRRVRRRVEVERKRGERRGRETRRVRNDSSLVPEVGIPTQQGVMRRISLSYLGGTG